MLRHPIRFAPAAIWLQAMLAGILSAQAARWILWNGVAGLPLGDRDFATALPLSLRFDLVAAAYVYTPLLIVAIIHPLISGEILRKKLETFSRRYAMGATGTIFAIGIANFGFFQEYHDQFNPRIFGAIDDDGLAVMTTFLKTFHWGRYALVAALAGVSAWMLFFRPAGVARHRLTGKTGIMTLGIVLVLALGAYRGGYGRRPVAMKDAYVCADETANRLIPNPAYLLRIHVQARMKASDAATPPEFVGDIRKHAETLRPAGSINPPKSISELITQTVNRPHHASPPRQVYLLVMESYDKWPMLPPYDKLGLTDRLKRLAELGATSPYFVSGDSGTMVSLAPIITGIPSCDIPQNYQHRAARPFPTSITQLFKKLGYKTRLVYGGYGAWQRISDFARDQGFDEVVTGAAIPCPQEYRGEWGVPDGFLFDHLRDLSAKDAGPTFTLVMSTSYHPPYEHPLEKFGCEPLTAMPAELAGDWDGEHSLRTFSHLRYADQVLSEFVLKSAKQHPDAVFAITGDHWSRKFLNAKPTLSTRREVPFVLYAPGRIPAGTPMRAGVHADIVPTLLHLVAPDGFTFPAFGANLLASLPPDRPAAFGCNTFVHESGLVNAETPTDIAGNAVPTERLSEARRHAEAQKALGWWLLMRGDELPTKN